MEIKAAREKAPELKFKKEAEPAIHKGTPAVTGKEPQIVFQKKSGSDILGMKEKDASGKEGNQDTGQGRDARYSQEKTTGGAGRLYAQGMMAKAAIKENDPQRRDGRVKEKEGWGEKAESLRNNSRSSGQHINDTKSRNILTNDHAKEKYQRAMKLKALSESLKIRFPGTGLRFREAEKGGMDFTDRDGNGDKADKKLTPAEKNMHPDGTDVEAFSHMPQEDKLKIRRRNKKAAGQPSRKEWKKSRKGIQGKGKNQAVRQRKLQYMVNKLSGSEEQDSLWQMAKDIVRMKASAVTVKTVKYLGALLVPLLGMLFLVAFPAVLIVVLLYCSPIAAFMENPSGDTPSIQEVLGGYYMEFNQAVSANAGESGTVAYLHEKDGNYVSNYMDTLMVYMVRYGTGDLGVVMDEKHQRLLKEIFDEMNGFEDQTVITTVRAGQSLGKVVTSAYCSCSICCGPWAGGPTASGAVPKADHTIAVDATNPFVPMGTRIFMGGKEYVVEDTGAFARYGVQFDIYFDSHAAAAGWGHVEMEAFLAEGDENTVSVTRKGSYVKNLNFEDYIALGKLNREQEGLLREVMSEGFRSEIPSSGAGSDVANLALTKVGCQYSQERRYEEGYYDCSSLVQRCYAQFGINLPAIASTQGQYMVEHGLEVTEDMLEPGDVIFYSYENNGQFRNISHVAIYIGNGRMVHASSPERGVVNDPFSPSNVGLYGRPGRGK